VSGAKCLTLFVDNPRIISGKTLDNRVLMLYLCGVKFTDMEEKILELIYANTHVDWDDVIGNEKIAKAVTAHVMEFIEWIIYLGIGDEDALLFHFMSVKEVGCKYAHTEQLFFKDIEEAYQYWLNNVKK
jgi:uncharacterized protein (DUF608 family)